MSETIKELPKEQRPYEKCLRDGPGILTDSELLAVILRTGTRNQNSVSLAGQILKSADNSAFPGLLGLLHLSIQDLCQIPGIGEVKAIQLKCIGELSQRMAASQAREGLSFQNPHTIADYYMERFRHQEQEIVFSIMLDNRNHLLKEVTLTKGTANASLITPREIFLEALRSHALSIILLHNHPSGDPSPSGADVDITGRVQQAGEMIGISLLDHIIIGDHKYFSFREQGLMDNNV